MPPVRGKEKNMTTGIAGASGAVGPAVTRLSRLHRILLICGVLSSLLWVAADIAASLFYAGYSYADYSVSELTAIGAPTRLFLVLVGLITILLELALAVGVWRTAGGRRGLRITASLMLAQVAMNLALGVVNLITPFAAMHTRAEIAASGSQVTTDTLHLVYAAVTVVLILSMIGFAAGAFGRRWRWYSLATIATALLFGAWAASYAPQVAANLPTPWLGLIERVNVYSFYLWQALLALMLLRTPPLAHAASGSQGLPGGAAPLPT
jgi:hypothetical protein